MPAVSRCRAEPDLRIVVLLCRDKDQKEIDLLIEQDNILYPIEIKKTATPSLNAANNFNLLTKLKQPIGRGAMLCLRQKDIPLSPELDAIPIGYL